MVYRASALRVLGFTHIVIGSLMMVFGIVCIAIVRHWTSFVGFGIWVGIWVSTYACMTSLVLQGGFML